MKFPAGATLLACGALLLALLSGCGSSSTKTVPTTEQVFYAHSVVFDNNSTLIAAGYNGYGQMGQGNLNSPYWFPARVAGLGRVRGYAAGANHVLAFSNDSTMYAWGSNLRGRLGVGNYLATTGNKAFSSLPVAVKLPAPIRSLATGWQHSLAVAGPNRSVYSWGANNYGQLGNGGYLKYADLAAPYFATGPDNKGVSGPENQGTLDNIVQVAAGGSHSLALREDGTVWAWGDNQYGQLGYVTSGGFSAVPQQILSDPVNKVPLDHVTAIVAAGSFSAALKDDGTVWTWGFNHYGQLGHDPMTKPFLIVPEQVNGVHFVKISAGVMHMLALTSTGEVWSWGFNERGQLGDGTYEIISRYQPQSAQLVKELLAKPGATNATGATDIYAFGNQSFARINGNWYGWGDNGFGQIGQFSPPETLALIYKSDQVKAFAAP